MVPPLPRTVILDYYDSYTNNLLTLFTQLYSDQEVLRKVVVIKADRYTWEEFRGSVLPETDCIILSPGPGRPDRPADIGFGLDLLRAHPVPILGVCLGHQAIGVAFGGTIINTPRITHGHVIPVAPVEPAVGLFASPEWQDGGADKQFDVVVYNSLTVDPINLPAELEVTAWSARGSGTERTIQGLRHKQHPIWGVQYHPESISSTRGAALLRAFVARVHSHHSAPSSYPNLPEHIVASCAYRVTASSSRRRLPLVSPYPTPPISPSASSASLADSQSADGLRLCEKRFGDLGRLARTADAFEAVVRSRKGKERAIGEVWLDGETPTRPTNTSIACPSFLLTYNLASRVVTLHHPSRAPVNLCLEGDTFWDWFSEGQQQLSGRLSRGKIGSSGWKGGWVGWFGYEMKAESLAGYPRPRKCDTAAIGDIDAAWMWCDRILERRKDGEWIARGVIREHLGDAPVINGYEDDHHIGLVNWLEKLSVDIGIRQTDFDAWVNDDLRPVLESPPRSSVEALEALPQFQPRNNGAEYRHRVNACREAIRQGESYELTLTTRFCATLPPTSPPSGAPDPLSLYLRLRTQNPAYYSTYINLPHLRTPRGQGLTILSSSPERFLKVERGVVEMMPIKGTRARVRPGTCCCPKEEGQGCDGGDRCREIARLEDERRGEELRSDPKERAENLMIVDLIRSDLLSACPPSSVQVPKLIALESYGVHNLVTTVRGELAPNVGVVEAVRRCFPPGSMTGAPKLRSVRLLEGFEEGQKRGVYSGCLGYFSLDGSTDLSVVIRTMVLEGDQLSLGAGGAITWLSDPLKEWDEVLTKVRSVVGRLDGVE